MATVTKRGDTYKITVSCGYDINGKQIRRNTTWKPASGMTKKQIEKELERQTVLFEERCRTGQYLDGSIRFADFAEKWMNDYADKQLKAKTVAGYKELLKRINPAIGHIKLEQIQPQHLLQFYDNLSESGIRKDAKYAPIIDLKAFLKKKKLSNEKFAKKAGVSSTTVSTVCHGGHVSEHCSTLIAEALKKKHSDCFRPVEESRGLSQKTILHHHRLIPAILNTAVQWQVIFSNPCTRIKAPKVDRSEAKYLDDMETIRLFELLESEPIMYRTIITLLVYSGLRRGELCGLEWRDIDFKNKIISIERASLYLPEKGIYEDSTKNYTSERVIKVSDQAFKLLLEYKMWQNGERIKMGDKWIDTGKVFTQSTGKAIHSDTITGWFHKFVARNNLPNICVHSLRHTNASLLIANNVNITTVSKRLGHANTATTTKIYAHAIRTADEIAADTLQDILTLPNKKAN